jgi:hypothetical protein
MRVRKTCLGAAVLVAVAALAYPGAASAQGRDLKKLHVLLIIDTNADGIGDSVRVDQRTVQGLLELLPKNKVATTVLQGNEVNRKRVLDYYARLQAGSDDALFCYYSGHGGTDPDKGHFLALNAGPLTRAELREAMNARQAGLSVLLTDCCSSMVRMPRGHLYAEMAPAAAPNDLPAKLMGDLFLRARGVADITASTLDLAWGDDRGGGMFTTALSSVILNRDWHDLDADRDGTVSWKEFFPRLRGETEEAFKDLVKKARAQGNNIKQETQTPKVFELKSAGAAPPSPTAAYSLGVTVAGNGGTGVRITAVEAASTAAFFGLAVDDVILSVNDKPVSTPEEHQAALDASGGQVRLLIRDHRSEKNYRRKIDLAPAR